MRRNLFSRRLRRIQTVFHDFGLKVVCRKVLQRVLRVVGLDFNSHADWLRQQKSIDTLFDASHGTRTGGVDEIVNLTIVGDNLRHGLLYAAVRPDEFDRAIRAADINLGENYTFIDLGCGKGRALLLAANFNFKRIIGVEFAAELVEDAAYNIQLMKKHRPNCNIEVVLADAAKYEFPLDPLVIFLHNPFGPKIIREVAKNALQSWRNAPRAVIVCYMNPVHLVDFEGAGWSTTSAAPPSVFLKPSAF